MGRYSRTVRNKDLEGVGRGLVKLLTRNLFSEIGEYHEKHESS